jgi:hypothetical protein
MNLIVSRQDFVDLAYQLGVRHDWHEPDEQGLTARVEGRHFDNAGTWPAAGVRYPEAVELHVIFSQADDRGRPVQDIAAVNLATLCAWAAGTSD